MGSFWDGVSPVRKSTLLRVCIALCVLNVVLVSGLAVTGVLKTVQTGDVTYQRSDPGSEGAVRLPADSDDRFVVERPTDADAFYNMVVRVRNGLPMYNHPYYAAGSGAGEWHYAPVLYFLFAPLAVFGYVGFQVAWLALSLLMCVSGTYIFLRTELVHRALDVSQRTVLAISAASIGFMPMVTNFKSGHPTPLMYLALAVAWWGLRTDREGIGGMAMLVPWLTKPYLTTPLVVFASRDRYRGLLWFVIAVVGMNLLMMGVFGVETVLTYYGLLVQTAAGDAQGGSVALTFESWWSNKMKTHLPFGPLGIVLRVGAIAVLGVASLRYMFDHESSPLWLFSLALLAVFFLLTSYSFVDTAILLAVFVLVGVELYANGSDLFVPLVAAFLLFQGHAYTMEVLVGYGATSLSLIASNETLVMTAVPYLQPAVYGLFVLAGVVLAHYWSVLPPGASPSGRNHRSTEK